jgi:hypothetical protein
MSIITEEYIILCFKISKLNTYKNRKLEKKFEIKNKIKILITIINTINTKY